jgi:misacylated tRNA(Ala) deacylase
MDTYGDLNTIGWGMGADGNVSHVDLSRCPSMDEIQEIQYKCNEVIRSNLTITVETPPNTKSDRLPGNYDKEQGIIRIIKIGDLHYDP